MLKYVRFTIIGAALALVGCKDDEGKGSGTNATNPSTNPTTDDTDSDTSTGSDQTSNGTTSGPNPTSTTNPNPTDDSATAGTESSTGSFITPPDGGGGTKECDVWTQDCPAGQKCMPWADNGSSSWNATKCSPVDANPGKEGDPCTVEGSAVSGVDTCDVGLLCWYFDENNNGSCIDMCKGTPDAPTCDSGQKCDVSNDGVLILCLETCDPLVQSCPAGQICFWDFLDTFICDFDASGDMGAYGDPCAYVNVCDYGLYCASPETVPDCDNSDGCCSSYCNVTEPNTCPGMAGGQECVPWYTEGMAPPGQENIGACAIPA
ncbi:hypothetical protein [Nannocystis radixulma]|uniref:Uncharacterized protein n=1 Tax=Nannocystis radixulma TaxID=2995305 RepID=A0ABT5AWE8_9BACT|nr:hypothetical protein [Nannocystis radixulma]MDC0666146.1 hypothetical protein [Nannocystis radixulma]